MTPDLEIPLRENVRTHRCRCAQIADPTDQCLAMISNPDDPVCDSCRNGHLTTDLYAIAIYP